MKLFLLICIILLAVQPSFTQDYYDFSGYEKSIKFLQDKLDLDLEISPLENLDQVKAFYFKYHSLIEEKLQQLDEDYLKSTRDLKYIMGKYGSKTTQLKNNNPTSLNYHKITMKQYLFEKLEFEETQTTIGKMPILLGKERFWQTINNHVKVFEPVSKFDTKSENFWGSDLLYEYLLEQFYNLIKVDSSKEFYMNKAEILNAHRFVLQH